MNPESRPLTAQERDACQHDLAGFRTYHAESLRFVQRWATLACAWCRRERGAAAGSDKDYFGRMKAVSIEETQAELQTAAQTLAAIRALERDLTEAGSP